MQWYIINDQNEIGPFSKDELKSYFEHNKISSSTLIKSERMKRPMTYTSIFTNINDISDKLPSIPNLDEVPEFNGLKSNNNLTEEIAADNIESVSDINDQIITDIESLVTKRKHPIKIYISLLIVLLTILGSYLYLKTYTPIFVRPKAMSITTYKKIKKVHNAEYLMSKVYLSKDKKTIWFATNNYAHGKVRISLRSIKDRILSKDKVILTSDAVLENGIATFNRFIFESNNSIVDGEYMVNLENISTMSESFIYSLKRNELNLNYRQKMLLTNSTKSVFSQKLKRFLKKLKRNNNEFLNELIQKYLTLKTIVEQIKEGFLTTFSNTDLEWAMRAEEFEELYKKKFGPFFTSFVIANEKQYEFINKKEFSNKMEVISDYTRLTRIAKEVGLMSVGVMEEYENYDFSISSVDETLTFKESILEKFDNVILECTQKISYLSREED